MRFTWLNCRLPLLTGLAVLLVFGAATAADDDKDYKDLFNGKDFTGLKFEMKDKADPAKTWSVMDGVIVCTGKPNGYLYTDKSFKNYHLKLEVKFARPKDLTDDAKFNGNSGVLCHITGDPKVWPKCIEAQGLNKDMANLFAVSGAKGSFKKDAEAQKKAIKPVGDWNLLEVISHDGEMTTKVNGVQIATGKSELTEGPIGLQSEGAEIYFKNLKIKEMK